MFFCDGEDQENLDSQTQSIFTWEVTVTKHLEAKLCGTCTGAGGKEMPGEMFLAKKHRGCCFTSLWSCHLTRDIGHVAVGAGPAWWAHTASLGQSLDTCASVLTGRPAAQIHQCLQREKTHRKYGKCRRNSTGRTRSRYEERELCNPGSPWHWKVLPTGQHFPSLS